MFLWIRMEEGGESIVQSFHCTNNSAVNYYLNCWSNIAYYMLLYPNLTHRGIEEMKEYLISWQVHMQELFKEERKMRKELNWFEWM